MKDKIPYVMLRTVSHYIPNQLIGPLPEEYKKLPTCLSEAHQARDYSSISKIVREVEKCFPAEQHSPLVATEFLALTLGFDNYEASDIIAKHCKPVKLSPYVRGVVCVFNSPDYDADHIVKRIKVMIPKCNTLETAFLLSCMIEVYVAKKGYDKAQDVCNELMKLSNGQHSSPEIKLIANLSYAHLCIAGKDFIQAEDWIEEAMKVDNSIAPYEMLAKWHLAQDGLSKTTDLKAVIDLYGRRAKDPWYGGEYVTNPWSWNHDTINFAIISLLFESGFYKEAVRYCQETYTKMPPNIQPIYNSSLELAGAEGPILLDMA